MTARCCCERSMVKLPMEALVDECIGRARLDLIYMMKPRKSGGRADSPTLPIVDVIFRRFPCAPSFPQRPQRCPLRATPFRSHRQGIR